MNGAVLIGVGTLQHMKVNVKRRILDIVKEEHTVKTEETFERCKHFNQTFRHKYLCSQRVIC